MNLPVAITAGVLTWAILGLVLCGWMVPKDNSDEVNYGLKWWQVGLSGPAIWLLAATVWKNSPADEDYHD